MERVINLGDKVECTATGHIGIVYGYGQFLHAVDAYYVRAQGMKEDGSLFPSYTYEETQLNIVEAGAVKA